MRWRRIGETMVAECVEQPDIERESATHGTNVWKRFEQGWMRVVYVEEEGQALVVTVIYPAKAPKEATP